MRLPRAARDDLGFPNSLNAAFAVLLGCVMAAGFPASDAAAQCTPAASAGPVTPPAGTTVTCSGATLNQNGSNGYGTGDQNGLTIDVLTGATVTGTGNPSTGIALNAANIINNSGAVAGFSNGVSALADITIVNAGAGTIFGNVFGVLAGTGVTLNNAGSVTSSTTGISAASVDIVNSGTIFGNTAAVATTGGALVTNSGTINSSITALNIGTDANVTNQAAGVIFGNSSGIAAGGSVTLSNAGSITANITAVNAATSVTVTNSATISGLTNGILAGTDVTVTNTSTATISGGSFGISAGGHVSVDNAGAITSATVGIGAASVDIVNSGAMFGNTAAVRTTGSASIVSSGSFNASLIAVGIGTDANITNLAGGVMFGNVAGISAGGNLTLANAGSITSTTTGVIAGGNASITNANGATISGAGTRAIDVTGNVTLVNSGTINGFLIGVNSGANATITNSATGTIFGNAAGVQAAGSVSVDNAGSLTSSTVGIGAGTTANVTNSGTIFGNSAGVLAGTSGVVVNSGSIGGSSAGIFIATDGDVTNLASGTITGAGNGIRNDGNLVLNNAGTITSSSRGINVGTGQITNTGTITAPTGLFFNAGPSTVFNAGNITGTGGTAIQFAGSGNTLTLGPGSTITGLVNGTGADIFQLGGSGTATFDATTLGVQYLGFSTFNKIGSSAWSLTGTGAQNWSVQSGTMFADGNFTGTFTVTGGILGGNGTIGGLNVQSGGIVSPGHSIGTLNVGGPVNFAAGSTYRVEINAAGQSDRIAATGAATLNGGTVQVLTLSPLQSFAPTTTYTILTAASVTGAFSGTTTTTQSAFLRADLVYQPQQVLLNFIVSPFTDAAQTRNQRSVAAALGTVPSSALANAVFNLASFADARGAFDALSGEVHASAASSLMDESLYMRSAVLGRLRQAAYRGDMGLASLSLGGPQTAFDDEFNAALGYAKSPATKSPKIVKAMPLKAVPAAPPATQNPDLTFWAQGFGAWGRFDSDGNAAALKRDLAGFISGVDARVANNGRLGIAAGYTGSRNNTDGRGSANIESVNFSGYGGWSFGALNLRAGGAYAWHSIDTERSIVFPGFFDRATARYDGYTGQIFGEAGYGFALGAVALEPFAGGAWVSVRTAAATERGGLAALNVAGSSFEVGYSTLGLRLASLIPIGHDMVLIPRASAAWQHAFDGVSPLATLAFQSNGAAFTVAGVPIARDSALVEAGLDLAIGRHATLGVSYVGQLAGNVQDHAAKGKFAWRF